METYTLGDLRKEIEGLDDDVKVWVTKDLTTPLPIVAVGKLSAELKSGGTKNFGLLLCFNEKTEGQEEDSE